MFHQSGQCPWRRRRHYARGFCARCRWSAWQSIHQCSWQRPDLTTGLFDRLASWTSRTALSRTLWRLLWLVRDAVTPRRGSLSQVGVYDSCVTRTARSAVLLASFLPMAATMVIGVVVRAWEAYLSTDTRRIESLVTAEGNGAETRAVLKRCLAQV